MKEHILEVDDSPSLKFTGKMVASAMSGDNKELGRRYSGEHGRWKRIELYVTQTGKYVCYQENLTRWQGERNTAFAAVCETDNEVIRFFGSCWIAKELYEEAGIEYVQYVS